MPANPSTDLLVITCASGKQVSALLPLITNWARVRLIVNSAASQERLKSAHATAEVIRADLSEPASCIAILRDATVVYHIGPDFHPHETEIGYNMVDAAVSESQRTGKFQHFIYSSVLNSQLRNLLNHDRKRYVEEYLMESRLNYTILQPTHFMDTLPIGKLMEERGEMVEFEGTWTPDVPFSFLLLHDLGQAVKVVLEGREKHYLAYYPIVGTTPMTYREVCEQVGDIIGKKIVVKQAGFDESVKAFLTSRFRSDQTVDEKLVYGFERLIIYYNRHGLVGNPNTLEWLIGRKPTGIKQFVEEKREATKPQ